MNIKLYQIGSGFAVFEENAILKNQRITLPDAPEIPIKSIREVYARKSKYKYEFDNSLKSLFKEELNTVIYYNFLNQETFAEPLIAHTKLTYFQKIQISWQFDKCWLQNSNNIMWIVNIIVASIAVIFAAKAIK